MNKLLNRIKFHKNNTSVAYSIVVDGKDDGFIISYDLGSWERKELLNTFGVLLRNSEVLYGSGYFQVVMDEGFREWYVSGMNEVYGNVSIPAWKWEVCDE